MAQLKSGSTVGGVPISTTDHTHTKTNITDFSHTHTKSEITDIGVIPTAINQLTEDSTHRTVTDTEKSTWNSKANGTHTHVKTDIADFSHRHNASEIDNLVIGEKKVARFIIGTSTAGWTASDCDYLCDGTADQTEFNNAITALPATGGEIIVLDGTYNITSKISINKSKVALIGKGDSTILKRMWNSADYEGVITIEDGYNYCTIKDLYVDGNKATYTTNDYNNGIAIFSDYNEITNNTVTACRASAIRLNSAYKTIIANNKCIANRGYGIFAIQAEYSVINNNMCIDSDGFDAGIVICYADHTTITGNISCNNYEGISIQYSSGCIATSNICNNNRTSNIILMNTDRATISSNVCINGTGLTSNYTASQYTIRISTSNNNFIIANNCMGKDVSVASGTGNTIINNRWTTYADYTAKQVRNMILSTDDAVLGSMADGDIWIKYV